MERHAFGVPQGGVVSPILSSIYLHKLDSYVETVLIPRHTRGARDGKQPLVARFGGIPLARRQTAVLTDRAPGPVLPYPVKELTIRLRRGRCELCEEPARVQVHQIRKLAQLGKPGPGQPSWAALMTRKRRKTLVVCHPCHDTIHHGQLTATTA